MNTKNIEEEIYEIDNKKYRVITCKAEKSLTKEQLKKLICNYAIKELQKDY